MKPLDADLNAAIMRMAYLVLPHGFNTSPTAPQTYEELVAHLSAGNRMTVWDGASDQTIYADASVNFAFRAWHDWCHYHGKHPFTAEGEYAVCKMMCLHLVQHFGPSLKTFQWCRIITAEVWGQQEHFYRYGKYPDDQRAFVEAYLDDPAMFGLAA